jgi:hypothetical protein
MPAILGLVLALLGRGPARAADSTFPQLRPTTRVEAVTFAVQAAGNAKCLTPAIQALRAQIELSGPIERRVLALLQHRTVGEADRAIVLPDGTRVYAAAPSEAVQEVARALEQARHLIVDGLGLPAPTGLEVDLVDLGGEVASYLVPRDRVPGQTSIFIDTGAVTGAAGVRSALIHQYAHAVAQALGSPPPPAWSEAFAAWAVLRSASLAESGLAPSFSERLVRMREGLVTNALDLAAGNALWLAFLDQDYGPAAVGVTLRELAQRGPESAALDRALRRVSGSGLAAAFREFHVWSVLVGSRSDGRHFDFAEALDGPRFASAVETLPALAVRTDPGVRPWGATQVRISPDTHDGGLSVRFEGEVASRWEADLLLTNRSGMLRRVPIQLSADGAGEATVPLDDLVEVLLLVRRLGGEDAAPRRYTYAAHVERGFPFEIGALEASGNPVSPEGIEIAWETQSERDVIGFNVLRSRGTGTPEVAVNPVWVPAVGDAGHATSYRYLDRTAEVDTAYTYRIQGITTSGLTSESEAVSAQRPAAGR